MTVATRSMRDHELPYWILAPAGISVCLAFLTPNAELTIAAIASVTAIILLLRRRGEPVALLFVFGMQWLQGSLKVFQADVLGVELWTLSRAHHIEAAIYLTLAWTVFLALGARIAVNGAARLTTSESTPLAMGLRSLVMLYAAWSLLAIVLLRISGGGANQIVLAFCNMRWSVVFAIFVVALKTGRGLPIMWAIFALEIGIGFLSFFSDFKVPLFLVTLAVVSSGKKFTPRQMVLTLLGSLLAVYLGALWSAVKTDYRDHLNQETGDQVIVVDTEDQINELITLFGAVDAKLLATGFENLVERIAYVDYFGYTLDHVPAVRPHEGGKLWLRALRHIAMPRLLFADKAPLQPDTMVTAMYTGLDLGRFERSTSITMGLPAITYVDFGSTFMFVMALMVGLLHGGAYGYFRSRAPDDPLTLGFATAVIIQHTSLGASADKVLGAQVMTLLVALAIWKLAPGLLALRRAQRGAVVARDRRTGP